jgi:hypothetical protein
MKNTLIAMSAFLAVAAMGSHTARAADEARMTTEAPLTEVRPMDASPLHLTPMILGEVTDATEHSVTLNTARGEHMSFETDSRTVMPMNLGAGSRVKVEFHLMDNGMHHAGRIATLQPGSADWTHLDEQLSLLQQDRSEPMAMNSSEENSATTTSTDNGSANNALISSNEPTSTTNDQMNANSSERTEEANENAGKSDEKSDELPRTASNRAWMLVLGLGVFAAAFGQRMVRKNGLI